MAKHKPEIEQTLPEWDQGTYQTGSTTPPKASNGVVTILLLAVILLGGIASALGILNGQQLRDLTTQPGETVEVQQGEFTKPMDENAIFTLQELPAPQIPEDRKVTLQMVESPYYTNNVSNQSLKDGKAVYEANRQSLVEIYTLTHTNSTHSAVGVILSEDGYILTNAYLVEAAKRIVVYLPDGTLVPAAVVGSDNMTDLAVLYVEAKGLTPAVFGTSKTLQVADPVYTVSLQDKAGMPMEMKADNLFTASRKFSTAHYQLNLLQICKHSENGPLFNSFGQIVGLCVSRTAQYFNEMSNLGIVLGSNAIQTIVMELVEQGYVSGRPDLGFEVEAVSKLFQYYWDLPCGLMVSGIRQDSDAAGRGLENGDIILALSGISLQDRDDLYTVLYGCGLEQEIIAVVFRNGTKKTVVLKVTELGA